MDTKDILGFAQKAVPWITAAATGNVPALIAMAAQAVSGATGTTVAPEATAITQAIATATPEQLLALKQADNDFSLKMREMDYKEVTELAAGDSADTADARARDVAITEKLGTTNKRATGMLIVTVLALVGLVTVMLIKDIDANTALGGVILLLIGKFSNAWDTAFAYEFGTTRASKGKDETITNLAKGNK